MSFNSSSSFNTSLLPPPLSSSNSSFSLASAVCFHHRSTFLSFTAFCVTNILLLLPVCILVLYVGVRRWQRSSSAAPTSHSDVFTYHMVAMEMIGVVGCAFYCCGACVKVPLLMTVGVYLYSVTSSGQIFFHILTCVVRYLAVVRPVTYQGLRTRAGIRIRNVTIGCIWLLFFASFGLTSLASNHTTLPYFGLLVVSVGVVSFCSLSVLRALKRPGPGEGGTDRGDQSKMRAFHTIVAILGALLFRFGGHLLVLAIHASSVLSEQVRCGLLVSGVWFCLSSSLVLPLLFLHRAGKLPCCESGQGSE